MRQVTESTVWRCRYFRLEENRLICYDTKSLVGTRNNKVRGWDDRMIGPIKKHCNRCLMRRRPGGAKAGGQKRQVFLCTRNKQRT